MGHGLPMARMRKRRARGGRQGAETAGGAPVANMPTHPGGPSGAASPARSGRIARLRERWRNASLKTSFMGYMLVFLVAALVLSPVTASVFAALQNEVTADAYETSGLYLYDTGTNALVPARSLAIDQEGNELFVQRADDGREPLPIDNPPASLLVESAQSYPYAYRVETGERGEFVLEGYLADSSELSAFEGEEGIAVQDVPAYDARARKLFDEWAAKNPDNPYRAFLDTETGSDASESSQFGDLLVSPIGYYAHTVPSEDARALSTLFGLLTFLMFPLWFGACIFAAARRFYRMRLAPGFSTLDAAAAKIADQDLDFSVSYGRSDELGRLAASFEAMRTSLAASQRALWRTAEERKRLNAAFAHDLRTPLTILKGKVELLEAHLQAGDASPEQLASSAASLAAQVERLERYVAAMSGLQKLEDRAVRPDAQPFDAVADAVEDIGRSLCAQAGGTRATVEAGKAPAGNRGTGPNVAFALSISARCNVERPVLGIDRSLVEEVAENLVGNAARFADGRVDARLDVRDGFLVLAVEDDGPGFSPAALERGCAPFFSETPSKDHFGLGLNIAALLCDKHGGDLALENRAEGGARATARFALIFPAVDSQ